jgi:hypothetical protein
MKHGTARKMATDKRADARLRRAVAQEILVDLGVAGDPRAMPSQPSPATPPPAFV